MTNDAHEALCHALDDDEVAVDGEAGHEHSAEELAALLQGSMRAKVFKLNRLFKLNVSRM